MLAVNNPVVTTTESSEKVVPNTSVASDIPVVEDWKEVKTKKNKSRAKPDLKSTHENATKDDLLFMMDEELSDDQLPLAGRKKNYTDYSDIEDEYEISDQDLGKLILVTQTPRKSAEQPHDRTGDWTTRVKLDQEISQIINDGLYYYEEDLWQRYHEVGSKQHKNIGLISQEDFELYSGSPKKMMNDYATPPPPPPPTYIEEAGGYLSGENQLQFLSVLFLMYINNLCQVLLILRQCQ